MIHGLYHGDGPPVGYVVLTESNTLSADGNSLTGTYDMKRYDVDTGNLLGHMTGTTVGRRIDFDQPFPLLGSEATGYSPCTNAFGIAASGC